MKPVHWVIQENQSDAVEVRAIVDALKSDGHVPHLVWLQKGSLIPEIPDLPNNVPLVCQGPAFIPRALNYPRLRPGVFFNLETFCWSAFRAGWKENMLSSDGHVVPLSAARDLLTAGIKAFIRPDSDSKIFEGGVYDSLGLAAVTANQFPDLDKSPVVIASPINIETEWRFFIVDKNVVGCSEYRRKGRISTQGSVPYAAIDLAGQLALSWGPADIYCLDLATNGEHIGVVEANCFNASRFYSASHDRVLQAVNSYVLAHG